MTKFNIPDPPEKISREALVGAAYILVAVLKTLQVNSPDRPIAKDVFAQLRQLHQVDREFPILKGVDPQEMRLLSDYLETLFHDPKLDLLFSKTKVIH